MAEKLVPRKRSMVDIKSAIPSRLFEIDTVRGIKVLVRNVLVALALAYTVVTINQQMNLWDNRAGTLVRRLSPIIWALYWWFQSLTFAGIWVIGHECGHGAFSNSKILCDSIGIACHTFLWTPYYSWKYSHKLHHQYHAHMEKDQHWIPRTRTELACAKFHLVESADSLLDVPFVALLRLVMQQIIGFPCYLLFNASGQTSFSKWTSHFNPFSVIFQPGHRFQIIISDLLIMLAAYVTYLSIQHWGYGTVMKVYGIPCLLVSHWVSMVVFLQHTDVTLPHYRSTSWTYLRGALATMDRPFLGWQGRFFLHDVAHFHVIHHFFPKMPFYHAEEATSHLKQLLGSDYRYSTQPVFESLWKNMSACHHVDDEGDVLYWKDRHGSNNWLDPLCKGEGGTVDSHVGGENCGLPGY